MHEEGAKHVGIASKVRSRRYNYSPEAWTFKNTNIDLADKATRGTFKDRLRERNTSRDYIDEINHYKGDFRIVDEELKRQLSIPEDEQDAGTIERLRDLEGRIAEHIEAIEDGELEAEENVEGAMHLPGIYTPDDIETLDELRPGGTNLGTLLMIVHDAVENYQDAGDAYNAGRLGAFYAKLEDARENITEYDYVPFTVADFAEITQQLNHPSGFAAANQLIKGHFHRVRVNDLPVFKQIERRGETILLSALTRIIDALLSAENSTVSADRKRRYLELRIKLSQYRGVLISLLHEHEGGGATVEPGLILTDSERETLRMIPARFHDSADIILAATVPALGGARKRTRKNQRRQRQRQQRKKSRKALHN